MGGQNAYYTRSMELDQVPSSSSSFIPCKAEPLRTTQPNYNMYVTTSIGEMGSNLSLCSNSSSAYGPNMKAAAISNTYVPSLTATFFPPVATAMTVAYLVPDTYESARTISIGPPSKGGSKIGKANGYAGVSKHGSRTVSSSDLMKYFREDLYRRLLSTDYKKQVDGIEML